MIKPSFKIRSYLLVLLVTISCQLVLFAQGNGITIEQRNNQEAIALDKVTDLYNAKEYQLAFIELESIKDRRGDDNDAGLCYYQGLMLNKLNQYDQAVSRLNRAQQLDPTSAALYSELGYSYIGLQNFIQAIAMFNKHLESRPADKDSALKLSYCYYQNKNTKDAIGALTSFPFADVDIFFALFNLYLEINNTKKAHEVLERILKISPDDELALETLGKLYFNKLNDASAAVEVTTRLIELQPDCGKYYYHRSVYYAKAGDSIRSKADLEEAGRRGYTSENSYKEQ